MHKFTLLLIFICLNTVYACKTKKNISNQTISTTKGATLGIVSFKYKAGGCSSVILIKNEDGGESSIIPKDKLDSEFDKDGLEIYFDYTPLRMPTPAGCTGMPAQITNVSKK